MGSKEPDRKLAVHGLLHMDGVADGRSRERADVVAFIRSVATGLPPSLESGVRGVASMRLILGELAGAIARGVHEGRAAE